MLIYLVHFFLFLHLPFYPLRREILLTRSILMWAAAVWHRDFLARKICQDLEVPDPYFGGEQGFEDVFNLVYKACQNIAFA